MSVAAVWQIPRTPFVSTVQQRQETGGTPRTAFVRAEPEARKAGLTPNYLPHSPFVEPQSVRVDGNRLDVRL